MTYYGAEYLAAREAEVWSEVQQTYGGDTYRIISDDGNTNHVLLVEGAAGAIPTPYIVKIPGYPPESVFIPAESEVETLTLLHDIEPLPGIATPQLLAHSQDPPYSVISYVAGEPLSQEYIQHNFSSSELAQFGRDIGRFIAWFGSNLPIDQAIHIQDLTSRWDKRIRAHFAEYDEFIPPAKYPKFHEALRDFEEDYNDFDIAYAYLDTPVIAGHYDLRPSNLTFLPDENGKWRLHGVIDFGDTSLSTLEWEARHLMFFSRSIGRIALSTCREQLGLDMADRSQAVLSEDAAYMWSLFQAVRSAFERIQGGHPLAGSPSQLDTLFKGRGIGDELQQMYSNLG
jgi:hypothetical protein